MDASPFYPKLIPLTAAVTHQPWGVPGKTSLVAHLKSLNNFSPIHPDQPYSEFVVGSRAPNTETTLAISPSVTLSDHIRNQVIEVDPAMLDFYSKLHQDGIPYLLKIVSVVYPQPLRVHPDTPSAEMLAQHFPNLYKDTVAKPIMAVAISEVDVLLGFQSAVEIVSELSRVPEFADAVGRPETDHFVHIVKTGTVAPDDTKKIISSLLSRTQDFIRKCLANATARLSKMPEEYVTDSDRELIALHARFPDDPMCFAVYFLNRVLLEPANAIFIHPQEPYTFLSGDFIEATTDSETVINAGLCTEEKQTDHFLRVLSFDDSAIEISSGEAFSNYGVSYVPPVPQFQLFTFKLPSGVEQEMIDSAAPSILLVLAGEGFISIEEEPNLLPLHIGSLYYLHPQTRHTITARTYKGSDQPTLEFVQIGVNESAAPSSSSSCAVM